MVLHPAATRAAGRVVINAPRWNPELGGGYCVAQTTGLALLVQPCRPGAPNQIWHVVPVGDSGQFRLDGRYGVIRVEGRTGLQTVPGRAGLPAVTIRVGVRAGLPAVTGSAGRAAGSGCHRGPPGRSARPTG